MRRSPVERANEIRLKRQEHQGSFLIVEGRDDRLFFQQRVFAGSCSVIVADGKANVIDTVRILEADSFTGIVGIVDADLDHIEGERCFSDNVITLETTDLEALLVRSVALDGVLVEFGSRRKIARFDQDIRETLLEAAMPVGCLRLYSRRAGVRLRFEGLRYGRCVERNSLTINAEALVEEVVDRSQRHDLVCRDIVREVHGILQSVENPWLVCHGVDMVAILSYGLRTILGSNNTGAVDVEVLNRCLRLGYPGAEFVTSELARELNAWSARNSGFCVLEAN
ncbi:MAG: DUF4435 domain-containing protein [Gemmatimonadetes bacterium]|nr:DUF4435 domain-containing protein [Gemmatimonadota bacterium]